LIDEVLVAMMLTLAARNITRHRGRTAMTLAAIATGIAALILSGGFVQNLYRQLGESLIHSQSGHLQVARPAYFAEGSRSPEAQRIPNLRQVQDELARVRGVSHVMARLNFSGLLSNSRSDLPIIGEGIEPLHEAELSTSIRVVAGRFLRPSDRTGALIGEGLAKSLNLAPGSAVTMIANTVDGAINTAELDVVGVFRSFSRDYDARAVKIPLAAAQDLLGVDDANTLVLLLSDTGLTAQAAGEATGLVQPRSLVVKDWQQLNDFYASTVALYDRQFGVLMVIILFLIALGVSNTVNMAVMERMGEFGTMRAMGNRGATILKLILCESALVGIVGMLIGVTLGVGLALVISAAGIPMPPPPSSNVGYIAGIDLSARTIAEAAAIGVVGTVLAAILPALRARSVPIIDALRTTI